MSPRHHKFHYDCGRKISTAEAKNLLSDNVWLIDSEGVEMPIRSARNQALKLAMIFIIVNFTGDDRGQIRRFNCRLTY